MQPESKAEDSAPVALSWNLVHATAWLVVILTIGRDWAMSPEFLAIPLFIATFALHVMLRDRRLQVPPKSKVEGYVPVLSSSLVIMTIWLIVGLSLGRNWPITSDLSNGLVALFLFLGHIGLLMILRHSKRQALAAV